MAVNVHGFRLKDPEREELEPLKMVHKWRQDWLQFSILAALLLCIAFGVILKAVK